MSLKNVKNHVALPALGLGLALGTLPFGPLGSLVTYVCVAGLVAYAVVRLTIGTGYRLLAGAAVTFALTQMVTYFGMGALSGFLAIIGYLQVAGLGIFLFRRRVRRVDHATLLEAGAVASVGATFVFLVSRTVSGPSADWIIQALTVFCAVLLFATLMGRERNKHIAAISVSIAMAAILELAAARIPPEHYDRIWSLVYLPVLYGIGLPPEQRQLKLAPIPARRAFGPLQQLLFNSLQLAPLVAIGIGAASLPSDDVVNLVAMAAATAVLLMLRFRLLVRLRDWSYGQERKLRTLGDNIISSGNLDSLDRLTLEAVHSLIGNDGVVAIGELDDRQLTELVHRGELRPVAGRYRTMEFGDDVPQADEWFETQGHCAARVRIEVPRESESSRARKVFLAATSRPINADVESHFRSAAAQYSLAVRANVLDAQIQEERANSRFAVLSQDINDVVFLVDPTEHRVLLGSTTAERILGFKTKAIIGSPVIDYVVDDDRPLLTRQLEAPLQATASHVSSHRPDVRLATASGEMRWFEVQVRDLGSTDTEGLLVSFSDVHDRKMAGLNLQNSEAKFRALVQNSLEVSMLVKDDLTMTYVSPNVASVFDFTSDHLVGSSLLGFVHTSSEDQLRRLLDDCRHEVGPLRADVNIRCSAGDMPRLAEVTATRSVAVGSDAFVLVFRDITARRELEESLLQKSVTDEVTGTLNRSAFVYQIQVALQSMNDNEQVALVGIELSNFSAITGNVGFEGGDQVLAAVADRLRSALRAGDSLSRPSGSEFAICATVSSVDEGITLARRLREVASEPVGVAGLLHDPEPVVGIAVSNESRDPNALLRHAIVAVGRARDADSGTVVLFEQSMQDEADERFELAANIRTGVLNDQFSLAYQPLISLTDNTVVGFEALLRWNHPERGNVSPGVFIPLAETNGTIIELGRWALRTACSQMVGWQQEHPALRNCHLSVNLSASQLERENEIKQLIDIIRQSSIDPEKLTIELTESTMMKDPSRTCQQLGALRRMNIDIAIDDFGTGVSGLSHLRDLPFDVIKLDKSYIDTLGVSQDGARLVQQIIDLARAMGAETVGEGIESSDQAETLRQMGCQVGQGFYLARPMDGDKLIEWMQAREAGQLVL